jgi:hypothetical protein
VKQLGPGLTGIEPRSQGRELFHRDPPGAAHFSAVRPVDHAAFPKARIRIRMRTAYILGVRAVKIPSAKRTNP